MNRLLTLLVLGFVLSAPAAAKDYMQGDLHIMAPWSRPLPAVSVNGAAYMTLMNTGSSADRLVSVSTPAAKKAELHNHFMEGGLMKMRPVEAVEVPPGGSATLQPGGLHVMLMGLTQPLVEGRSFPLTLNFEHAGSVEVQVTVGVPEGAEQSNMKHDMKMGEKKKQGG